MENRQTLGYTQLEVIPMFNGDAEDKMLKQLEEIDNSWQKRTGFPWLTDDDYQDIIKAAGQGVSDPDYTLEELLAQITPENVHEEVRSGKPRGKEIW